MILNTGHRNKSSLIFIRWLGEGFEASLTDDSFTCHLIVLFFVFSRFGTFMITDSPHHSQSSHQLFHHDVFSMIRSVFLWWVIFCLNKRYFYRKILDMIENGNCSVFDTVVGVHVYISDNFIPQWHQHSEPDLSCSHSRSLDSFKA